MEWQYSRESPASRGEQQRQQQRYQQQHPRQDPSRQQYPDHPRQYPYDYPHPPPRGYLVPPGWDDPTPPPPPPASHEMRPSGASRGYPPPGPPSTSRSRGHLSNILIDLETAQAEDRERGRERERERTAPGGEVRGSAASRGFGSEPEPSRGPGRRGRHEEEVPIGTETEAEEVEPGRGNESERDAERRRESDYERVSGPSGADGVETRGDGIGPSRPPQPQPEHPPLRAGVGGGTLGDSEAARRNDQTGMGLNPNTGTGWFDFVEGQWMGKRMSFTLSLIQQPSQSRMTGFGEKDRRPIDPPPVVRLGVWKWESYRKYYGQGYATFEGGRVPPGGMEGGGGEASGAAREKEAGRVVEESHTSIQTDTLLCHAELYDETMINQQNHVYNPAYIPPSEPNTPGIDPGGSASTRSGLPARVLAQSTFSPTEPQTTAHPSGSSRPSAYRARDEDEEASSLGMAAAASTLVSMPVGSRRSGDANTHEDVDMDIGDIRPTPLNTSLPGPGTSLATSGARSDYFEGVGRDSRIERPDIFPTQQGREFGVRGGGGQGRGSGRRGSLGGSGSGAGGSSSTVNTAGTGASSTSITDGSNIDSNFTGSTSIPSDIDLSSSDPHPPNPHPLGISDPSRSGHGPSQPSPTSSAMEMPPPAIPLVHSQSPTTQRTGQGQGSSSDAGGALPPAQQKVRNLVGGLTVTAKKLKDDKGEWGIFFIFGDLAVRAEGTFTMRFTLMELDSRAAHQPESQYDVAPALARVFSEPFKVYAAKNFPGMASSTILTKTFSKQGVKLMLRKVSGRGQGSRNSGNSKALGGGSGQGFEMVAEEGRDDDDDRDEDEDSDGGSGGSGDEGGRGGYARERARPKRSIGRPRGRATGSRRGRRRRGSV